MKNLALDVYGKKKEFSIPTEWSEISIKMWRSIININETSTLNEQRMMLISILIGIDMDIVEQLYTDDFRLLESEIEWLVRLDVNDDGKLEWVFGEIPTIKKEFIEINGEKYYYYSDFNKLTMGEEISLNILTEQTGGNILAGYNKLLCILLRKKDESGKLEKFKSSFMDRAELFDNIPIVDVHNLMVFFSTGKDI